MKNTVSVFSLLFLLIFASCQVDLDDEGECNIPEILLLPNSLEEVYGCSDTRYMEVDLSEDYALVRSQEEFESLVTGEGCSPEIDFTKYDLVIGKKGLTSGNTSIDYELGYTCNPGELLLQVTFNQNGFTEAPNITYHALIPKLGDEQYVTVELEVKMPMD